MLSLSFASGYRFGILFAMMMYRIPGRSPLTTYLHTS